MTEHTDYDDGRIRCDDDGIRIAWYFPWGAKRIPYSHVRGVEKLPLSGFNKIRKWRIWGSGDFVHWWNLDSGRPRKDLALVLNVGRHIRPTITPDDPGAVEEILRSRSSGDS